MTGCRINKFGIFTISWLRSVCMNVKARNKFIEIKCRVSNGLVIFITNYWWFRILEISRYRRINGYREHFKIKDRTRSCHKTCCFQNDWKGHDSKVQKYELWILHSASRLIVFNICMKFPENILNSFNIIDLVTETAIYKVQRGVTKKIHKQELWFLSSARRPIKLNIRMKFHEDILNGFQVRERTRFCDGQTAMSKTISPRPEGGI